MQLVCRIVLLNVLSMLIKICKNTFLLLTKTTGEISQTTLRSYSLIEEKYSVKISSGYQMNTKGFLYNTAFKYVI